MARFFERRLQLYLRHLLNGDARVQRSAGHRTCARALRRAVSHSRLQANAARPIRPRFPSTTWCKRRSDHSVPDRRTSRSRVTRLSGLHILRPEPHEDLNFAPLEGNLFTEYNEQFRALDDEMDRLRALVPPRPPSTPRRTRPRGRDEPEPEDTPTNRRRRLSPPKPRETQQEGCGGGGRLGGSCLRNRS